ncbi:MerR family transcriptional regulator [Frankia sp. Cppng1_Ct_nod]|uniref:MerR family transcriptional regulator n=1 Tax=Frankia sp. Cppng1_Ct_nod TaxID=2897162 RepID=UPI001F5FE836|nr:MerR family transcriptional regulator [Frankia sp. Cppng1_Ct_nod]
MFDAIRTNVRLRPSERLPITRAATVLGTTPRMLRYRESLGLLIPMRSAGGHREYGERDLVAAAYADELERRYDIGPRDLAFALRVLTDPEVAADVRGLGRLNHRLASTPVEALDFDAQKARRLLRMQT